jgi:hypothetical protein
MAVELAQAGIQTTLIPDCAVFAMMARVNKVLPCRKPSIRHRLYGTGVWQT